MQNVDEAIASLSMWRGKTILYRLRIGLWFGKTVTDSHVDARFP